MKPQHKSKTNWLGLLVIALPYIQENIELFSALLHGQDKLVMGVIGLAIIILRQFTDSPVGKSNERPS